MMLKDMQKVTIPSKFNDNTKSTKYLYIDIFTCS